jgi:hypothetical protein
MSFDSNPLAAGVPNLLTDPVIQAVLQGGALFAQASGGVLGPASPPTSINTCFVPITCTAVAALTLAVPVVGLPSAGGNDGQSLVLVDTGGHAHTVTTPANAINGVDHIATFNGTKGSTITLRAYAGVWYATSLSGVTLS